MLRVMRITGAQWSFIWAKLMPMQRRSADWVGTDNLILNDEDGPILLTIGKAEVITEPPERVRRYLDKFEQQLIE
ncbi:MAG TPA: hypothetical protein VN861_03050 [Candidatus Acidoferrales bacterium]|nr:hypothetical protein [Candidatus Acidoferrales bacterium]